MSTEILSKNVLMKIVNDKGDECPPQKTPDVT